MPIIRVGLVLLYTQRTGRRSLKHDLEAKIDASRAQVRDELKLMMRNMSTRRKVDCARRLSTGLGSSQVMLQAPSRENGMMQREMAKIEHCTTSKSHDCTRLMRIGTAYGRFIRQKK